MMGYRYDILDSSRVRWTIKGKASSRDFIYPEENYICKRLRNIAMRESQKCIYGIQSNQFMNNHGYVRCSTIHNHRNTYICSRVRQSQEEIIQLWTK